MINWLKRNYPYIAVLAGAFMIPYVLITTPSLHQSKQRFVAMKSDLRELVEGAQIISLKEVDKYGVASLSAEIAGKLLGPRDFSELGWVQIDQSGNEYCKDGMVLYAHVSDQIFMGERVLSVSAIYNARSILICKNVQEKP